MAKPASLGQRDLEAAATAWKCMKGGEPKIDYEEMAKGMEWKNARASWQHVKKKLLRFAEEENVATSTLSPRDLEAAALAWKCFKGDEPKLDYGELGKRMGWKNARASWQHTKKKLMQFAEHRVENGPDEDSEATEPAKTPRKRKAAEGATNAQEEGTPSKKCRHTPKKNLATMNVLVQPETEKANNEEKKVIEEMIKQEEQLEEESEGLTA